jgi:hypothetical protein
MDNVIEKLMRLKCYKVFKGVESEKVIDWIVDNQ